MAIDISQDLIITLLATGKSTPTITGVYDVGNPPGTYIPGRDYAEADDVSTGTTVQYNFSIAFDSLSNQLYTLDKVYIQSVDDPRTDGTGNIFGYWINTNPDPTDITDDGQNTLIPQYNSSMTSIVFDSTANIRSDSTVATGISVTLPSLFWWKSKIMPQIRVVAVKDGIEKISAPLQLDTVRLSTAANLPTTLSTNPIAYTTQSGQTGFVTQLYIRTFKSDIANITRMLDAPNFDLVTYKVNYNAAVNGANIPLTTNNFSILSVANATLVSSDYTGGVLTLTVKQTNNNDVGVNINVFIPFNPGSLTQATVTINGDWIATSPVTITDFVNSYLFTQSHSGSANYSQNVIIVPIPPEDDVILIERIGASLTQKQVFQSLDYRLYSCPKTKDSTFIRMIDSEIASFGDTVSPIYRYYVGNQFFNFPMPTDSYTILYGNYDFTGNYDPNIVSQQVINGTVQLKTYAQLIAENKVPNIMAFTITKDLLEGITVNYNNYVTLIFDGNLDILTQEEFKTLYDTNPKNSYPTYLYSYMSVNTCYTSVSEAYTLAGAYLQNGGVAPTIDSFTLRNNNVYLNLGTLEKQVATSNVSRFNSISSVKGLIPFDTIDANLNYIITNMDGSVINTITNYTLEYCLAIRYSTQPNSDNANTNMPVGTTITITLPNSLLPYIYISSQPFIRVRLLSNSYANVNIYDYNLQGNLLTLTLPIEINLNPDSICVPVKFIIPSNDLQSTFVSIGFSNPLVYKDNPNSLIYGFTTASMMFKVNTFTQPFTLKGAQIDTTGLSVSPNIYERNQPVTYIATVYNLTFSPSSDYCMSMTVPTNQYNPVESSNNSLKGYITRINPTHPNTTLYYQIEANVTAQDIHIMKTINRPGGPTLKQYFDSTIVNTWILYVPGQPLPSTVVMMVGCTPNILQNTLVRIDYDVVMDIPEGSNQIYTNDAVFNYYSSGSNLEAQSNVVQIQNRVVEPIPITKIPPIQYLPLENNFPLQFTTYFNAPLDYSLFQHFTVTDKLHPALALDPSNTKAVVYPNTVIPFTLSYDSATNTVTINIPNSQTTAGQLIVITIATTVADTTKIPFDPVYNYPALKNEVDLILNNNPQLKSTSEPVVVIFIAQPPKPVPIQKAPLDQIKPLENGTPIAFTAVFIAPTEVRVYKAFELIDQLHPSLTFDETATTVIAGGAMVPYTWSVDALTNTLSIEFTNTALTAGKEITITIATMLTDITKVPASLIIENFVDLIINADPTSKSTSNTVIVTFTKPSCPKDQAITDLIESVALEQAALSHILNAEGEKIQKILAMQGISNEIIIQTNKSVADMIHSISMLEMILQGKLGLFKDCLCEESREC